MPGWQGDELDNFMGFSHFPSLCLPPCAAVEGLCLMVPYGCQLMIWTSWHQNNPKSADPQGRRGTEKGAATMGFDSHSKPPPCFCFFACLLVSHWPSSLHCCTHGLPRCCQFAFGTPVSLKAEGRFNWKYANWARCGQPAQLFIWKREI